MKTIQSLINNNKIGSNKVIRIRYMPYNTKIAKHVWFGIAKEFIEEIQLTPDITDCWNNLIKYVHADESCKYDLTKNILLMGKTGSGKTETMRILSQYISIDNVRFQRNGTIVSFNFEIVSARKIYSDYVEHGVDGLAKYLIYSNICIDDFGAEPEEKAVYYGSKLDVLQYVIEERYTKGLTTHFTTNLKPELIKERYGDRVHSRVIEQTNQIRLNDRDFRL